MTNLICIHQISGLCLINMQVSLLVLGKETFKQFQKKKTILGLDNIILNHV